MEDILARYAFIQETFAYITQSKERKLQIRMIRTRNQREEFKTDKNPAQSKGNISKSSALPPLLLPCFFLYLTGIYLG